MLGGTVVNITGPCFNPNERVLCKFDTESVIGHVIDRNRAICVQPFLMAQGYIRFEISIGTENFKWRGRYFVGEYRVSYSLIEQTLFESIAAFQQKHQPQLPIKYSSKMPMFIRKHQQKYEFRGIDSI